MCRPVPSLFAAKEVLLVSNIIIRGVSGLTSDEEVKEKHLVTTTIAKLRKEFESTYVRKDHVLTAMTTTSQKLNDVAETFEILDRNPDGSELTINHLLTDDSSILCLNFEIESKVDLSLRKGSNRVRHLLRFFDKAPYSYSNIYEKNFEDCYSGTATIFQVVKHIHKTYCIPEFMYVRKVVTTVKMLGNHKVVLYDHKDENNDTTIEDVMRLVGATDVIDLVFQIEPKVMHPAHITAPAPRSNAYLTCLLIFIAVCLFVASVLMIYYFSSQP